MVQNLLLVLEVADVFLPQHPSLLLAFYHVTMFDALIVLCSEKKNKHRFEIDECYLFGKVIEFVIVKVELQSCVNNDSCVVIQKSY